MLIPWSCVLLLLSLTVPTVSFSVLLLLEPPFPPKRLLGWLTMRDKVSKGFSAAFTVLAMLGLKEEQLNFKQPEQQLDSEINK